MFKTKKDVDAHVRASIAKLRTENERKIRGFTIAKLYFKINEYQSAVEQLCSYLSIKSDNDQAYKMLGQCYRRQKKPDKALESFQRSLQLNPKQPDLLVEVCELLNEDKSLNINKAKYWCDLAESEKVQHDAVFSLRLKLLNKDNIETNQVEELIQKEILSRPQDISLRVRLLKHFIEQNKIFDAYQNTCQLEKTNHNLVAQSAEWYNMVSLVLSKYEKLSNVNKDWQFWLLLMTCLERQVNISFTANKNLPNGGATETANLLFNLDQYLHKFSQTSELNHQKELAARFIDHYQGQLCLHAAALIFKRELVQNKNKWKETIKSALPLLLLAYQSDHPNAKEPWTKHCDEHGKQLIQRWNREGAFRCAQVGRTLLACIEENNENTNQLNNVFGNLSSPWTTPEALISELRQCCSDKSWRRNLFGQLFCNSDQKVKEPSSFLIKCAKLSEPVYELPTYAEIEQHEETAQYLNPQSLQHMVYLCLGNDNLADVRSKFFNGLNFSTQNLSFCGAESLNQLDVETFLYAATLQAKRLLDVERKTYDSYHAGTVAKPKVLPFVNIQYSLCTEEQINWWTAAYQVYKNLASDNLAEIRANLQYGIEAVRGINGPKIDMIIVFQLGRIFEVRASYITKPVEKAMLEARSENLYKYGLNMLKMSTKGVLEPFKRYFKYANANSSAVEREVSTKAEDAVRYLAHRYFKKSEYEELIEELAGVQLPFAMYLQSEAYRKLDEANKTPKKAKRMYLDKASECLNQTLQLLKSTQIDPNHPLNSVIHSELKRLQQSTKFLNENSHPGNNSSSYEDAETEFGMGDASPLYNGNNRARREVSFVSPRTVDLENLVKQIANMLTTVKEELVENIKPEVVDLKKEVAYLKEKLITIEENMRKKSNPTSRDDGSNVLDDLYIIEDELQNQMYSNQQQQQQQQQMQNIYGSAFSQQHPMAPRMNTPTAVTAAAVPPPVNPYNSPMYGNYAMNYYAQQFMMPPQQSAVPVHPSQLPTRNPLNLPFGESPMNFNMSTPLLPPTPDNRNTNLFGLLTQNQQQLGAPIHQQPAATQTIQSSIPPVTQKPQITPHNVAQATAAPPNPITFNKSLNNMPVEKGLPVNVVITSSDPLPINSAGLPTQPMLSVTIPSHHIKPSLVASNETPAPQANTNFPMVVPAPLAPLSSAFNMKFPTPSSTVTAPGTTATTTNTPAFSFKPPTTTMPNENLNNSNASDLHKSETEVEYDPRPDFKPIIPLPDEVEVKTGEENEEVMFCSRSKLFRYVDKEWKERGVGDIKILKDKEKGTSRILMRRDQTHKICANHRISSELNLTKPKGGDKGFIWAANDFADEAVKLEKFLVRFKTAEIAEKFQVAFNVARNEAKETRKTANGNAAPMPMKFGLGLPKTFAENKTSTPAAKIESVRTGATNNVPTTVSSTVPKSLFEGLAAKSAGSSTETKPTAPSPFANFSFDRPTPIGGGESKPFANILASFNNFPSEPSPIGVSPGKMAECHNKSDNEDEYVPTAQFQPVIPLPDLVEITTGEEDEIVLFEHRAKLLRFDKTTSEWKERGLGTIKILQDKNDVNKVRLVMRREVIHKLCCNQRLYKDTTFKYSKNSKTALVWAGQDYSENELQVETLTIRFKTADICKQFLDAVLQAQSKMSNAVIEENAKIDDKKTNHIDATKQKTGFGDKFKPKSGSWSCEKCYTSNASDKLYCAACEAPKDDTVPKKGQVPTTNILGTTTKSTFSFGFGGGAAVTKSFVATEAAESAKQQNKGPAAAGFGDKFKPKDGSWSCEQCYTSNASDKLYCAACEAPKDTTVPKKEPNSVFPPTSKTDFSFGFAATPKPEAAASMAPEKAAGFGDKFKPKEGSWACKECYLSNTGDAVYCKACDAPKDGTVPNKAPTDILALSNPSQKFTFGFASTGNAAVPKTDTASFTFGTGTTANSTPSAPAASGFTFGIPQATPDSVSKATNIFGGSGGSTGALNLSASKLGETKFSFTPTVAAPAESTTSTGTPSKPLFAWSLAPKTVEADQGKGALGSSFSLDKKDFNFTMKPKSPGKTKSPHRVSVGDADKDDEEEVADEEENNTYFTPVIPLPERIEVKTGEEDEEVMYSHRAKLYRFTDSEWKERGLGDVKILRHKQTKKLRIVMRREQVLKICLNHVLNKDVVYKSKDDKSWLFAVNDYSEGEVQLSQFCLRLKNKETAEAFMKAVENCLEGKSEPLADADTTSVRPEDAVNISDEDKKIADKLLLPYSFFAVDSLVTCSGCRGCDPDNFVFPTYSANSKEEQDSLPLDMSCVTISKPNRSILKPSKLVEEPTPTKPEISSIFGNTSSPPTNTTSAATFSFTQALNSTTTQEEKPAIAAGGFLFGGATIGNTFSSAASDKPLFGKPPSIFGGSATTTTAAAESTDKPKSIFGGSGAPLNFSKPLFTGTGTSIFSGQMPADSSSKFIFGGGFLEAKQEPAAAISTKEPQFPDSITDLSFEAFAKQTEDTKPKVAPPPGGGFIGLTHTNEFSSFKITGNTRNDNSSTQNESTELEGASEHDPHFEPIIPLPAEISLSTGEEDEEKLFGDRVTLYRYDQVNKEWKERGVGELKILQHKIKGTYRMVMRREQIHKLVLNHAVGADFSFNTMNSTQRSFIWATMNFAEEPAVVEKLSVRFRSVDPAMAFKETLTKCIEAAKSRAELEPEDD